MRAEDGTAERLEEALAALADGVTDDGASREIPPDLRPLVDAAAVVMSARRRSRGDPRPTFVLGLEEQLRTDLRMAGSLATRHLNPAGAPLLLLAALAVSGLVWLGIRSAQPDSPLYPIQRGLADLGSAFAATNGGRADAALDRGWRRVDEARWWVESGRAKADTMKPILDDLAAEYAAALQWARSADDRSVLLRAAAEAKAAESELARLAEQASGDVAAQMRDAASLLASWRAMLVGPPVRLMRDPTRPVVTATVTDTPLTPTQTATRHATATARPSPAVERTAAPPSVPGPTAAAPTETRSPVPAPTGEPASPKPPQRKPRTATPSPTLRAQTPQTPGANDRTPLPTRDVHPVTTTPQPPIVPTELAGSAEPSPERTATPPAGSSPTAGPTPGTAAPPGHEGRELVGPSGPG